MRPTWADIDADAFGRNCASVIKRLPRGAELIAVMKANAYGHGAAELAKQCEPSGVSMIAVALLEEALELRRVVRLPILVLGPLTRKQIALALDNQITPGIIGPEELIEAAAVAKDRDVHIHLKVDSGMGRMGSTSSELSRVVEILRSTPRLKLEAIYTHFANSGDPNDPFTDEQTANFDAMVEDLRAAGITAPRQHRANSGATMRGLARANEYVRVGIALYGGEALDVGSSRLEPVMRWRTEIARLKTLPPGHAIGYGMTYHTSRESRIAVLPVGYADGYNRLLSNRAKVLVRGQHARIVGRVSMDLVTIDVTDIPDAAVGDEVVLLGAQGDHRITAEELASIIGTISYEVFCGVSARVPRVYRDGKRVMIHSRFA